jgi:uncharacterized coiled-coil DUF342 family protein
MAKEFTKEDLEKLDAKIGELTKRHDALHASVDETHKAAQATKSETAARSSELRGIKQRRG